MLPAQRLLLFLQSAVDVHQTAAVGTQYLVRAGLLQRAGLVSHHRAGNVWHTDAECPTEATAFAFVVVINPLHVAQLRQQLAAVQVGVHFAACRTRGVQRDFHRFAAVLELHLADEQQKPANS